MREPPNPGPAVRRLNPHLFPAAGAYCGPINQSTPVEKRIRQSKGPNKLERDWANYLRVMSPDSKIREQSFRLRLASGAWYKCDITTSSPGGRFTCWECKGPKQMKGVAKGVLTIKVAATLWPEFRFVLVWRENGQWFEQEIRP